MLYLSILCTILLTYFRIMSSGLASLNPHLHIKSSSLLPNVFWFHNQQKLYRATARCNALIDHGSTGNAPHTIWCRMWRGTRPYCRLNREDRSKQNQYESHKSYLLSCTSVLLSAKFSLTSHQLHSYERTFLITFYQQVLQNIPSSSVISCLIFCCKELCKRMKS